MLRVFCTHRFGRFWLPFGSFRRLLFPTLAAEFPCVDGGRGLHGGSQVRGCSFFYLLEARLGSGWCLSDFGPFIALFRCVWPALTCEKNLKLVFKRTTRHLQQTSAKLYCGVPQSGPKVDWNYTPRARQASLRTQMCRGSTVENVLPHYCSCGCPGQLGH